MNCHPNDLKLVPLKDVPVGALAEMIGRSDIGFALRLADIGENARVMILGGAYSFEVAEWGDSDQMARIICNPDELRIELGEAAENGDYTKAGMLSVRRDGATITAKPRRGAWHGARFSLSSWTELLSDVGPFVVYSDWRFGRLDHRGEFVALFNRAEDALKIEAL